MNIFYNLKTRIWIQSNYLHKLHFSLFLNYHKNDNFQNQEQEIRKLFSITLLSIEITYEYNFNLFFQKQYYKIVYITYFALSLFVHRKIKQTFPKTFVFSKTRIFRGIILLTRRQKLHIFSIRYRHERNNFHINSL